MFGYIYKITNILNNRVYIGQKKSKVFVNTYYGSGIAITEALKKYGKENFLVEVLGWADNRDQLNMMEIEAIKSCSSIYNLYNIADGGDGGDTTSNHPNKQEIINRRATGLRQWHASLTEEHRKEHGKKISQSKKGKSNGHEGFKHSAETIEKIKQSNKDFDRSNDSAWSAAHKDAMEKRKGKPLIAKYKAVIIDGVEYESVKHAQSALGIKHRATFYDKIKRGHIKMEYKNDIQ